MLTAKGIEREVLLSDAGKAIFAARKWNGQERVDIRFYTKSGNGWKATQKGVVLPISKIHEVVDSILALEAEYSKEELQEVTAHLFKRGLEYDEVIARLRAAGWHDRAIAAWEERS